MSRPPCGNAFLGRPSRRLVWLAGVVWLGLAAPLIAQDDGQMKLLPPVESEEAGPPYRTAPPTPIPVAPIPLAPNSSSPIPSIPDFSAVVPASATTPVEVKEEIIAEEVVEYQWYDPHYWFRPPRWEGSIEAGINGSEGNANTFSIKSGISLKRTTDVNVMGFNLNYARTSTDDVETQHYALFNSEYERLFPNGSPWSLFAKSMVQYDEFQAFDLRVALNGGIAYRLIKTEYVLVKNRFGAGASREFGGPNEEWSPEAVLGMDYEHQLTKKQKIVLNVDYFPEWDDFNNFRLLTVFAWEVVLDEEANLHFKLSINDQYDSTPEGREPNDLNYSMLLLWKL